MAEYPSQFQEGWRRVKGITYGSTTPRVMSTIPEGIRRTDGPSFIRFAQDQLNLKLLPWQRFVATKGMYMHPSINNQNLFQSNLIIAARQQGKSSLVNALMAYWVHKKQSVIFSTASLNVGKLTHQWLSEITFQYPELFRNEDQANHTFLGTKAPPGYSKISNVNALWTGQTPAGGSWAVVGSTRVGGRGRSSDKIIVDELREISEDSMSSLSSTGVARNAQAWYFSNMGDDKSVVLNRMYQQALESDSGIGLFEYSATPGAALDDRKSWAQSMPGLGYIVDESYIEQLMKASNPNVFRTENMCIRVQNLDNAISSEAWEACYDPGHVEVGQVVAALDCSPDLRHFTLVLGQRLTDGRTRLRVAGAWGSAEEMRKELPIQLTRYKPRLFIWIPNGPAAAIGADIDKLKIKKYPMGAAEVKTACQSFAEQITATRVAHDSDPLLTSHVVGASKLRSGDGWVFSRREGHCDSAYAAALVVHKIRSMPIRPNGDLKVITA